MASLAGGDVGVAIGLGASMTALQSSIGALNDLVDAPADAGREPPKPIPAGLVSEASARVVAATAAAVGIALAVLHGPGLLLLGLIVLGIGYAYDLGAKGTAWSWLPFALGIPLLPVYGWYGATGTLPPFFAALVPIAVLAGAALAIANARTDLERDQVAGTVSVASWLGDDRAWAIHAALWVVVLAVAIGWLLVAGAAGSTVAAVGAAGLLLAVTAVRARGVAGRRRRWSWEAEAVVAAGALVVWLVAVLTT